MSLIHGLFFNSNKIFRGSYDSLSIKEYISQPPLQQIGLLLRESVWGSLQAHLFKKQLRPLLVPVCLFPYPQFVIGVLLDWIMKFRNTHLFLNVYNEILE